MSLRAVFLGLGLFAVAGYASTSYTFQTPSGASDGDGPLDATVTFTIDGTTLYISMTNDEVFGDENGGPNAAGQLLSDLTFVLSGGLTAGTLSDNISSTVGTSTGVTVISSYDPVVSTTTTTIPLGSKSQVVWQLSSSSSGYFLNDLTGGSPDYMIIGPAGTGYDVNSSITGHSPSLGGTVVFEVDGVTGLTDTTTVGTVNLSFGTGPDYSEALSCTSGCGGGGGIQSVPEPISLALTGSGLLALALFRRKIARRG